MAQVRHNSVLPCPAGAKYKLAVIEFNVPGARNGGSDKCPDGHRCDSIPICNGIIQAGASCKIIKYFHDQHDAFSKQVQGYDALLVRINPGQLSQGTSPGTQERFDSLMNSLIAKGCLVWSSPRVQTEMGAKDALVKIRNLSSGLPDTLAYYSEQALSDGFKKTMAYQPRVIKQNRGSAGEGIWLCWLEGKQYCSTFGAASCSDGDKLKLMEMNDNHTEYHTVAEFLAFCVDGPGGRAGQWQSTFPGKYLQGGKAAGGQLVDQRLLPRISEGEVRVLMVGPVVQMIIHKKPEGGLSAVGGNSAYTFFKPGCKEYHTLERKFVDDDTPELLKALGLADQPLPILWTADFIPRDGELGRGEDPKATYYVIGEFNCSCVGVSKFQAIVGCEKTILDVSDADYFDGAALTDLMGTTAIQMLDERPVRVNHILPQPSMPAYKLAVIEFNVPGARNGGSDKCPDGHRCDSIPIANGVIKAGGGCDIVKYFHDRHEEFVRQVQGYDALLVRINPGQLSQGTSPGTQERFDGLMNSLIAKGCFVWSSPRVQTEMGAKDALVKIRHLDCGLPDTLAYYSEAELNKGFKETMAYQPRVIKQNRGSAGEGIWLCWLEGKSYCSKYGEATCSDSDKLKLMEMNDNHVEHHTVAEFLEFCVNGPGGKAGNWKSTFPGKYLAGGKSAGGQLVDQRLLPRISEGEVRVLMVGPVVQMTIHKKPEDGLSAVGGNSAYTFFKPGSTEYEDLEDRFVNHDTPLLLEALGLQDQPLPILWTADFIPRDGELGRGEDPSQTYFVIGEFNCSCVGVSKFQAIVGCEKTIADVPDADYWDGCALTDLMGKTAISLLDTKTGANVRWNSVMPQPLNPKFRLAVIEFNVPGARNGGSDKCPDGHRCDSIPICNGVIKAGGSCEIIKYFHDKHDEFSRQVQGFDALLVRINPGQLSQGTSPGTQQRFDALMNSLLEKGCFVWSSPRVQTDMGAKDALVKINHLACGLPDTLAYYSEKELEDGFKKTMAYQPRVIKQNRGSAGEGIWLCWLEGKSYCSTYGGSICDDNDKLKLMEMNDNHTEYHTVREFLEFCANGPGGKAGSWTSTFPGKYLAGGKSAGGQLVDQRLLPRISEGEVRVLMVGPVVQMTIHKKPEGGLSAVGGNSAYTFYKPGSVKYKDLEDRFVNHDTPQLLEALGLADQPLPILWTADFIPRDGEAGRNEDPKETYYVIGEFNCSCVGVSKFQAIVGCDKTIEDVGDKDYWDGVALTDLMGRTAISLLNQARQKDRNYLAGLKMPAIVDEMVRQIVQQHPADTDAALAIMEETVKRIRSTRAY